ncbi:MAG TPA: ribosome recycling factor [Candidatus Mcinerneyibacteriales bacterium]|jgi:ribosome recycling factor|nr:ribosome recycling factor [Candidatus Mcinerneyibacteriota bacterium]HOO60426.1 ribosome recycling factor [Candidatus Mcinerneyibacteriales bacterium]HPE19950.1 ribosome recycling factor [Candidatus Mcinerneyibacteriales bacterium]HPJ70394.1 ribosome recycling factor [Candidatus Mcinerneyibacteriales bacterium]HPQ89532.1 ribosome recycling factor [Candidatus Mcinerneyibacteriales bacterium]
MDHEALKEGRQKMEKTLDVLRDELHSVRTGRASASLLDNITVDYYGTPTPVTQIATVNVPEPRTITISPWDVSVISAIEKAILSSNLGLNPANDGKMIRVPVPPLSEERRKDLVKVIKKMAEDTKIALRNIRRDENEKIKNQKKDGVIPEDMEKKLLDEIQKVTDEFVRKVDEVVNKKEAEIMEV